jgi:hypothetical protein
MKFNMLLFTRNVMTRTHPLQSVSVSGLNTKLLLYYNKNVKINTPCL